MGRLDDILTRSAVATDEAAITRIDVACLATGDTTFRETPHDWASFHSAFGECIALVAETPTGVAGWGGVSRVSARAVYRGVGEVSVYVDPAIHGRGIGRALLEALVTASEEAGFWTLTAQIFPENAASLALHARCGFELLGRRQGLGQMPYGPYAGKWRDVMFLERRSPSIGRG